MAAGAATLMNLSSGSWIVHCLLFIGLFQAQFWISNCVSAGECSEGELQALLQFKRGLVDPENLLSSWRGSTCCQWRGLSCDNHTGSVISIDLHNPYPSSRDGVWNLSGKVDPSLHQLKFLSRLDLSYNNFGGLQIPEFIGSLNKLRYLNISNAGFAGSIPSTLGNLSELQSLDLSSVFHPLFADSLQWVTGLTSLQHFVMSGVDLSLAGYEWVQGLNRLPLLTNINLQACGLSGITHSLSSVNFTSLSLLDLSLNSFNSRIPDWFQNLSSLVYLDISSAGFRDSIPGELSAIPNLRYLDLSMNGNLSADCFKLLSRHWGRVEVLNLASNQFFGRLPDSVGNISSLIELNLFSNDIQGGIPSSIGKLCNLAVLDLRRNNLTLGLPKYLEQADDCTSAQPLSKLRELMVGVNKLTGILPEWLGELPVLET